MLKLFVPAILYVGSILGAAAAVWPARIFAPYMYIGADDDFQITSCDEACGQKFYTLAFVIAGRDGMPAWDGRFPMGKNLYAAQINSIRHRGGDVIVSFGGAAGTEIAISETNMAALEEKYQSVIDRYQFTWLDFDIEGDALSNTAANKRRNAVLAALQSKNPGLIISFTLPVDPDGISAESQNLLADAVSRGVKIHSVNVMTMDFGAHFSKGKKMSAVSIASALKARDQCRSIAPDIRIGITPMIGQNDEPGEVFTQQDAWAVKKWAQEQPWICSLSFWASNRDTGHMGKDKTGNDTSGIRQKPWAYTGVFKSFTSGQ
ncbi:MAG TPA: chitinase [Candidatus Sulfotelmatobacter sp.]|nr:chitinase [Candidatus Sulfotelmatobacter sp.]